MVTWTKVEKPGNSLFGEGPEEAIGNPREREEKMRGNPLLGKKPDSPAPLPATTLYGWRWIQLIGSAGLRAGVPEEGNPFP